MTDDRLTIRDGACDTTLVAEYEATRRDAVRRGVITGGAIVAAATIPILMRVGGAFAQTEGDGAILEGAVGLEQTAVVAYERAHESRLLDKPVADVARLFRDQEQEHADWLTRALEDLGGSAPKPPGPEDVAGLGAVSSQEDLLRFAVELENMAVVAYVDAHRKLQSPGLLKAGAQIMANEGQHLVVLRQALGASPAESVPSAFEAGTDPAPRAEG
jgi:rubrerythrin